MPKKKPTKPAAKTVAKLPARPPAYRAVQLAEGAFVAAYAYTLTGEHIDSDENLAMVHKLRLITTGVVDSTVFDNMASATKYAAYLNEQETPNVKPRR